MTLFFILTVAALAGPPRALADADRDGIHDDFDQCPLAAEDDDDHDDDDGCPDPTRVVFQFNDPDGKALLPEVQLDHADVPSRRRLGVSLDSGAYLLNAGLRGYVPIEQKVHVPGGAHATLTFVMEPTGEVPLVDCLMYSRSGACRYAALTRGLP